MNDEEEGTENETMETRNRSHIASFLAILLIVVSARTDEVFVAAKLDRRRKDTASAFTFR